MRSPIKLVGMGAGFQLEYFGYSHYGLEDISAIRAIPNISIISPADCLSLVKAENALLNYETPAYLRLTGVNNNPIVYKEDFNFEIGKAVKLKEGSDAAIVATGSMVANAIKAADILQNDGISTTVIDMHTIKPLDIDILDALSSHKLIVTVEEHSIIGGLGSAVVEYVSSKRGFPPVRILGVPQGYKKPGSYNYMLEQSGLLPEQIAEELNANYETCICQF
jgi:transketolase